MSRKYQIDSSHSESHSMNVLHFANAIYREEVKMMPFLSQQKNVICAAAVLHDMCDRKYLLPETGLNEIKDFLQENMTFTSPEIYYTTEIMNTMSYSKVKEYGYPDLGEFQWGYHIVREADLLASYDFDRAIIYNMNQGNSLTESYYNSLRLFDERVFNYNKDKLLLSDSAQRMSIPLTARAMNRMEAWHRVLSRW